MKNIVLLKGHGVYGVIGNYIDNFACAFRAIGYNTIVIDTVSQDVYSSLDRIKEKYQIYAVVDCNGMQFMDEVLEKYDKETVVVSYFCDHPLYHIKRLSRAEGNFIILQVDKKHVEYLNRYYTKFQRTGFIPLAGCGADVQVPYRQRDIEVLFTGSYQKPQDEMSKPTEGNFIERLRFNVWEMLKRCPQMTLENVLKQMLERYQITVSDEEFVQIMAELNDIESGIRAYFRDRIIKTLLNEGIQVSVFGTGWDALVCKGKENLRILNGGAEIEHRALGRTKIVLNIMPWFKEGFQERISSGMLSGAVVVTDTSKYIEEEFEDGKDIILYHLESLSELPLKVKQLLADDEEAGRIAEAGKRKAQERHTWQNRVRKMAELIEEAHGDTFMEGEDRGVELEVPLNGVCASSIIKGVGIEFSSELTLLNDLYENGCATKEDAKRFVEKIVKWNRILLQNCSYSLIEEGNIKIFYKTVTKGIENGLENEAFITLIMFADGMLRNIKEKLHAVEVEDLIVGDEKNWNEELYEELIVKVMLKKYSDSTDPDIMDWVESIQSIQAVQSYPRSLITPYLGFYADIQFDREYEMIYVMHNGKRMYYPKEYTPEQVYSSYRFVCIEQDLKSPHRYLDDTFYVDENSVVIDAGAAEGNFTLDIIDLASKVYVVECDEKWIEALEMTFAPYAEKVEIIPKMLGNKNEGDTITIDQIAGGEKIDFIKMDVEGAEGDALEGAEKTLLRNNNMKCLIATYHKKNMEQRVKRYLEDRQFEVSNTKGYLFYKDYTVPVWENELRHALVRGIKREQEHE